MAKVFVSHRRADAALAERLANDLRKFGHEVWLDDDDIRPGDSIVGKIESGLDGAQYLVLCYSSSGVSSPWTSREWMSTLARQLDGAGVKVIPVRLTGITAPTILADIKYADLMRDWQQGLHDLSKSLL